MIETKVNVYSQAEISQAVKAVLAIGSLKEVLEVTTGLYSKKQLLDPDIYLELAELAHETIRQYDVMEAYDAAGGIHFIPILMSCILETPTEHLQEMCGVLTDKIIPDVIQVYFDAVHVELERRGIDG